MQTSLIKSIRAFTLFLIAMLGAGILLFFLAFNKNESVEAVEKISAPQSDLYTISETLGTKDFTENTDVKFVFDKLNGNILYGKGWGNQPVQETEITGGTNLWLTDNLESFDKQLTFDFNTTLAFFSRGGDIFYETNDWELFRISGTSGKSEKILGRSIGASVSPDGQKLVYQKPDPESIPGPYFDYALGLHVFDLNTRKETKITDNWDAFLPVWTPDGGKVIFYAANTNGTVSAFSVNPDGTKRIQLTNINIDGATDIDSATKLIVPSPSEAPVWSADGRYFVIESDRAIWVMEFSPSYEKVLYAKKIADGIAPKWSDDGKTLEILPPPHEDGSPSGLAPFRIDISGKLIR